MIVDRHMPCLRHKMASPAYGLALGGVLASAVACAPTNITYRPLSPLGPEAYEFANMRPSNMVPKSSPAAFEKAFNGYCLNGGASLETIAAKLRKDDYIATPRQTAEGQTAFVVDDSKPMVIVSNDGRYCAVMATARSGQTARIHRFIANRFPKATPIANDKRQNEIFIQTNGTPKGMIALKRLVSRGEGSRVLLAFFRTK
jgi:hypothetical protein